MPSNQLFGRMGIAQITNWFRLGTRYEGLILTVDGNYVNDTLRFPSRNDMQESSVV